jgi:translation initiation factor IF-1
LARDDLIELEGHVVDVLSGGIFKVQVGDERVIQAKISGKLRKFNIKVMMGDMVKVSVSPYDLSHGLITYRERLSRPGGAPPFRR